MFHSGAAESSATTCRSSSKIQYTGPFLCLAYYQTSYEIFTPAQPSSWLLWNVLCLPKVTSSKSLSLCFLQILCLHREQRINSVCSCAPTENKSQLFFCKRESQKNQLLCLISNLPVECCQYLFVYILQVPHAVFVAHNMNSSLLLATTRCTQSDNLSLRRASIAAVIEQRWTGSEGGLSTLMREWRDVMVEEAEVAEEETVWNLLQF